MVCTSRATPATSTALARCPLIESLLGKAAAAPPSCAADMLSDVRARASCSAGAQQSPCGWTSLVLAEERDVSVPELSGKPKPGVVVSPETAPGQASPGKVQHTKRSKLAPGQSGRAIWKGFSDGVQWK